jgi:hypothetical protein
METHDDLERWVHQRMIGSAPATGWPDAAAAWRRVHERTARRPSAMFVWAGATATVCAAILALPGPRAAAQILWDRVITGRIQVLMIDSDGPEAAAGLFTPEIDRRPEPRPVGSLEEASRVAGFLPRLPAAEVLSSASPAYAVADVTAARLRLRTPAMRYLLHEAGGSASEVPDSWDGAVLEARIGPVIIADYDGILLLQSLPFELIKPADLDLQQFHWVAFRVLGMSASEAWALSTDLSISPALLMFMPKEEGDLVRGFSTRSGTGVMIEDVYGPGKIVAVWSGPDRVYALYPEMRDVSREFIATVAAALD